MKLGELTKETLRPAKLEKAIKLITYMMKTKVLIYIYMDQKSGDMKQKGSR